MSEEPKGPPKIDLREILEESEAGDLDGVELVGDEEDARFRWAASGAGDDEDLQDRHLRLRADFENYRRRKEQEMADLRRRAEEGLAADLLPVLDNLQRALAGDRDETDPFHEGVELIRQQLQEVLQKAGLEEVPAVGEPFDPRFHEAVIREQREDLPPNTVMEEMQKGYTFHGRLLRPSMVKVSYRTEKQGDSAAPISGEDG